MLLTTHIVQRNLPGRPFALDDADAYRRRREERLAGYPRRAEDLMVELRDPLAPGIGVCTTRVFSI